MMDVTLSRHRPTVAFVNLDRLAQNFEILRGRLEPGAWLCPMVKANAYGHGDSAVAARLRRAGATHLGVGLIEEGVHLRQSGDHDAILHFGLFDAMGAQVLLEERLTPVISTIDGLELWARVCKQAMSKNQERRALHLKINTGMNRLGLSLHDVPRVAEMIAANRSLHLEGVATHFSDGEDAGHVGGRTDQQLKKFMFAVQELKKAGLSGFRLHVANSSGLRGLSGGLTPERIAWGARPGISLYGLENEMSAPSLGVKPVMQLVSRIVHIQDLGRGDRVSYGGHWQASRDSRIGVIPCGYADGYHRSFTGASIVVDKLKARVPVIGTVCMDYFMCDLTDVESARVGDLVVLFGDSPSVQELADRMGTISYEVLTGISERVPRLYVDGSLPISVPLNS
ncbi:MAG: alanine racemase [Bdellovibrionales bacterium]|nr:alanine racemase [Bdellovibrionales bacterium]